MKSFLDLPAEIRQRVYRYLYVYQDVRIGCQELELKSDSSKSWLPFVYPRSCCGQLLRTNRTILAEARSVFYTTTKFVLDVPRSCLVLSALFNYDHMPSLAKLCHVELQLEPKHLTESPALVPIEWEQLKSIKSFSIMLSAVEWYSSAYVAPAGLYKSKLTYENAYQRLRTMAVELLLNNGLDKLEDRSAPGYKVWFKLSTVHRIAPEGRTVIDKHVV